jgi:hypothetical protein
MPVKPPCKFSNFMRHHAFLTLENHKKAAFFCKIRVISAHKPARFLTDFARAVLCFHRLTGFGRTKKGIPFSGILRWEQSPKPQGHLAFRLAKYLHQLRKQGVRSLGGSQSRSGRWIFERCAGWPAGGREPWGTCAKA